jgi:hypothetical protein
MDLLREADYSGFEVKVPVGRRWIADTTAAG